MHTHTVYIDVIKVLLNDWKQWIIKKSASPKEKKEGEGEREEKISTKC